MVGYRNSITRISRRWARIYRKKENDINPMRSPVDRLPACGLVRPNARGLGVSGAFLLGLALLVKVCISSAVLAPLPDSFVPAPLPDSAVYQESRHLVRVIGPGGLCSGAPLKNTRYVVTAAHCVLSPTTGKVDAAGIVRVFDDGEFYRVVRVMVRETGVPLSEMKDWGNDAAVLILDTSLEDGVLLGGSGDSASGGVLVAYQRVDAYGRFYRRPPTVTAGFSEFVPASCRFPGRRIRIVDGHMVVPCAMQQGGSGGPVLSQIGGEYFLVGVLSSVAEDFSYNNVAPVAAIKYLLSHPGRTFVLGESDFTTVGSGSRIHMR